MEYNISAARTLDSLDVRASVNMGSMSARRHDLVYNSKFAWAKPLRQRGKDIFNKDIVAP